MPVVSTHIRQLAAAFWKQAGVQAVYPVTVSLLEQVICLSLPLSIHKLDKLSISVINDWLQNTHVTIPKALGEKPLYGLLLVNKGRGFIFLNGSDSLEEQCFTLAHELSHYLLDYDIPRQKAVRQFGKSIIEVLNGNRMPTVEEQLQGLIKDVSLQSYIHWLDRPLSTAWERMKLWNVEAKADQFALELLAPFTDIAENVQEAGIYRYNDLLDYLTAFLMQRYKLPPAVAGAYAKTLAYAITGGPTLAEQWGISV